MPNSALSGARVLLGTKRYLYRPGTVIAINRRDTMTVSDRHSHRLVRLELDAREFPVVESYIGDDDAFALPLQRLDDIAIRGDEFVPWTEDRASRYRLPLDADPCTVAQGHEPARSGNAAQIQGGAPFEKG